MNENGKSQELILLNMSLCFIFLCFGCMLLAIKGNAIPSGLVELTLGVGGFIFAFLAKSPLQK